ncbi:hypothetical protein MUP35_01890 [Patescibacteria group bacterium]|nr:hypothetical protein [Patescibacteria group bacterium]
MFKNSFVSIEPILDFDLDKFIFDIKIANPKFVSIGADSKGHNLVEPNGIKIKQLIQELSKFTEVRLKSNLNRLINKK